MLQYVNSLISRSRISNIGIESIPAPYTTPAGAVRPYLDTHPSAGICTCQTLSRHSPLCRNLYLSDPISTLTSLQESDDESEEVVHRVRVVHQTVRLRQDLKGWLGQRHCHFKKT